MDKPRLHLNHKQLYPYTSMKPTQVKGLGITFDVIEMQFPTNSLWEMTSEKEGICDLAKPESNCIISYMAGEGSKAHGLVPLTTILYDGENFYKRVTYRDLGFQRKASGFKRYKKNGLCWYLQKINMTREVFDNAVKEE
jgi:hypothetical protein